jgi:hypothetical protein
LVLRNIGKNKKFRGRHDAHSTNILWLGVNRYLCDAPNTANLEPVALKKSGLIHLKNSVKAKIIQLKNRTNS